MNNFKTALITGASSGIGFELISLFARDKINLILVARNKKKLIEIQEKISKKFSVKVHVIPCDLSISKSAKKVYDYCMSKNLKINYLVNNAGFGIYG